MTTRRSIKIGRRDALSDSEDEVYLPKPMPKQVSPVKKTTYPTTVTNRPATEQSTSVSKPVSLSFIMPEQTKSTNASIMSNVALTRKTSNDREAQTTPNHCLADHLPLLIDSHNRFVDAIKHAFETLATSGHRCNSCQNNMGEN